MTCLGPRDLPQLVAELGCELRPLPPSPALPSVHLEDFAEHSRNENPQLPTPSLFRQAWDHQGSNPGPLVFPLRAHPLSHRPAESNSARTMRSLSRQSCSIHSRNLLWAAGTCSLGGETERLSDAM